MSNLAKLEDRIAKLEEAADALRELTSEANSTLKQLRKERREVERLLEKQPSSIVDELIAKAVTEGLMIFTEETIAARNRAVEAVCEEFDKLADAFLEGDDDSGHLMLIASETRKARKERLALIVEGSLGTG